MSAFLAEAVWLNESELCSLDDLLQASGLSAQELQEFIESGVIEPVERDAETHVFRATCIVVARTARRLRDDFELDTRGVAVALNLLRRIRELEAELEDVYARLPRKIG
jgi:chaperone modulatory protein CbpM